MEGPTSTVEDYLLVQIRQFVWWVEREGSAMVNEKEQWGM
jgi:hypothetical protein